MSSSAELLNFSGWRRLPVIHQTEAAECGLACLAMIASYHGHKVDLNTLRQRYPVSLKGMTLRGLINLAGHLHLASRALRFELENLAELQLPAIVHWDADHFVVLKSVRKKAIVIHDPARGERRFSLDEASKHLTGVALELTPSDSFEKKDEQARLPLSLFWKQMHGSIHALVQIFVLSVLLQAFVLASPFYMQLAVDEVVARGDVDLLKVLAIGFGLLTLIKAASAWIRSQVILVVQNVLHFQIGARLFRHLVKLPMHYFEKRHVGDILSRFGSIEPIRNLLAEGMITALIDGLMAIATLVMIFVYSPLLASVVLSAFMLYVGIRLALYRMLRARSQAVVESKAQENSNLIETVRAVQSIKLFNRENEREGQWLNRYADVVNANVRLGRARIAFTAINDIVFGMEFILVVYLAAEMVVNGALTVGMIFAFMSYRQQFTDKSVALVEKALDFRVLDLHLERLADIALAPLEAGHDRPPADTHRFQGRIELRDVGFRYSESDPFVLEGVSFVVEPHEFVTISGPSGGGKTTMVKIMLGLLEPTSGTVLVDGMPLATIGPRAYREQVAAVMQDDNLLSGSIAENICFSDTTPDRERIVACAKLACIDDDIMAMPMAYASLIGDMGSSLSGGQRQRVLLARALYRNPAILVMDEGTAHLDTDNEQRINRNLRRLPITRISVAHRPEFAEGTDRVLRINKTLVWDSAAQVDGETRTA